MFTGLQIPSPFVEESADPLASLQRKVVDDGRVGVAYCYGCTQLTRFVVATSEPGAWDGFPNTAIHWGETNVFENTVSQTRPPPYRQVTPLAISTLVGRRFPGLFRDELNSSQSLGEYQLRNWAGIDCSGLVLVTDNYGKLGRVGPLPDGTTSLSQWMSPAFPGYGVDLDPDENRRTFNVGGMFATTYPLDNNEGTWMQRVAGNPYAVRFWAVASRGAEVQVFGFRDPPPATNCVASNSGPYPWECVLDYPQLRSAQWRSIHRGDLLLKPGHVVTAYSDGGATPDGDVAALSVEAHGDEYYRRTTDGASYFGRKVVIRPLEGSGWQPNVVLREILW